MSSVVPRSPATQEKPTRQLGVPRKDVWRRTDPANHPSKARCVGIPHGGQAASLRLGAARHAPSDGGPFPLKAMTTTDIKADQLTSISIDLLSDLGSTVPTMDGTGYPIVQRPDGTTVETAPTHCPNGHRLGPRKVIASWSPTRG
jgi:hypothetical protein